jgi:hypothetical protein
VRGPREVGFAGRVGDEAFTLTGVLSIVKHATRPDGHTLGVLTLPWNSGVVEQVPIIVAAGPYRRYADLLKDGSVLYLTGRTDRTGDVPRFAVTKVEPGRYWYDITPVDAMKLNLHDRHDIIAPLNELGERCAWPWDPQQLISVAVGMYHCWYCGAMCVAGVPHPTYEIDDRPAPSSPAANPPRRDPSK